MPDLDLQFNHFLVRDEQPLLFHAGLKGMFADLSQAVSSLIDPATLRYVAWSHFESDEIGGLNHWLELAPQAEPVCTFVGKVVSEDDFAPHLPHGWDAGLLFEETQNTLLCSDLLHQFGAVLPITSEDLIGPALAAMHGSSYAGDGARPLGDLAGAMRELFGAA